MGAQECVLLVTASDELPVAEAVRPTDQQRTWKCLLLVLLLAIAMEVWQFDFLVQFFDELIDWLIRSILF